MKTLEQITQQADFVKDKIEKFFKVMNTPDNIIISKDKYWGRRIIGFSIRLDEFSVVKLEEQLPQLKKLFAEYQELRSLEKELSDKAEIDQHIKDRILDSFI